MKRYINSFIVAAFLLLLASRFACSQTSVRLGADIGMNFANQSLSYAQPSGIPNSSRVGLTVGGIAELCISDLLYIQAEPRYIQKGMKETGFAITINDPNPVGYADLVFKLDYLEIPVLVKAKFGTTDFKPFVFAGPNIGFLLSAKRDLEGYDVEQVGLQKSFDAKDNYKSLDVSLDLGGGGEYQLATKVSLLATARYSLGLTAVNNETNSAPGTTIKSYGIQILIGALFNL